MHIVVIFFFTIELHLNLLDPVNINFKKDVCVILILVLCQEEGQEIA